MFKIDGISTITIFKYKNRSLTAYNSIINLYLRSESINPLMIVSFVIVIVIVIISWQADSPQLPSDLSGETFSHVFGTNTSR